METSTADLPKGEPMSRMIDADALEQEGWKLHRSYQQDENTMVYETKSIQEIPTAEPERKKGKWIAKDLDNFRKYEVVCSECGSRYIGNYDAYDEPYDFNYCPNCGSYNGCER